MKMDTGTQDVKVHGDFETSEFAIGDISFIVDMFADKVYSHKERAVIRELSCNAHDSHIMANTTDVPFRVHLPTQIETYFSIRDYGTGLTDHEVRTIFAGVGISTKRDSNEVIGCFGIGSLSPYSLTDSFTVKSYKDGQCRTYTCYRDDERKPVVALLTESATDEANGLEVSLTVEDRLWEFQKEAVKVFKFWEGTMPQINDKDVIEECKEQREKYVFQGDDFGLTPSWGSMVAIMGNIAYAIPDELDQFDTNGYLKFNLGELNFDTARENLTMDDKTKAAIKAKFEIVKDKLATEASQQIEDEPTAFKRATLANQLRSGNLGKFIKTDLNKYELPPTSEKFTYFQHCYSTTDIHYSNSVPVGGDIEYYPHKDRMKSRIRSYIKDFNKKTIVILSEEQIKECKIDRDALMDLDDLPKIVRQSYSRAGSTVKTFTFDRSCQRYSRSDWWDESELTIDDREIVFVEINRWEPQPQGGGFADAGCYEIKRVLNDFEDAGMEVPVVVGLKSAFLKTKQFKNGNFICLNDYLTREVTEAAPKTYCEYKRDNATTMKNLHSVVKSDELDEFIQLYESSENNKVSWLAKKWKIEVDGMEPDMSIQEYMDSYFKKYSMLQFVSDWEIRRDGGGSAISEYINGTPKN